MNETFTVFFNVLFFFEGVVKIRYPFFGARP